MHGMSGGHGSKVKGVFFFFLLQASNGEQQGEGAEGMAARPDGGVKVRRSGFPRIIKAGHGVKLGAVVSALCCNSYIRTIA